MLHRLATVRTQAQIHTLGTVAVAIMLVLLMAVAVPAWTRRIAQADLRAALVAADAKLQRTHAGVEQAHRDAAILQSRSDATAGAGEARTLDRRLLDISSVAGELGLFIDSVEPGAVGKRAEGDVVTAIAASGRGPYPRVVAFAHRLREIAPDLTVETIQLTAAVDGGCSFRLALNWWSPPATAPRPTAVARGDR